MGGFQVKNLNINGWAIEARVCSEDPRKDFLLSTGKIKNGISR